jgi:hypothetical protein
MEPIKGTIEPCYNILSHKELLAECHRLFKMLTAEQSMVKELKRRLKMEHDITQPGWKEFLNSKGRNSVGYYSNSNSILLRYNGIEVELTHQLAQRLSWALTEAAFSIFEEARKRNETL